MVIKKTIVFFTILLLITIIAAPFLSAEVKADSVPPVVKINIDPYTIIYEGDIINCTITGSPTLKYWSINNQSSHTTFHYNDPIILDPEPTPLDTNYVNLSVYAENEFGSNTDSIQVIIKRIYFGDLHWHSTLSDGGFEIDEMYQNAIDDKYLDFTASTEHKLKYPIKKMLINWCIKGNPW